MKLLRLFKRELAGEAALWIDKGIVTSDQASDILRLYGTELPKSEARSLGYYVLLSIAALFMGLAIIVFISANWDNIPRAIRMISLVALTVALHCVGLFYFKRDKYKISNIWFFLGSLAYGATIFLIAQIYHLGEHFPDGILYWTIGVLPLAILTDSILLMLLMGTLSTLWLVTESTFGLFPTLYPLFALYIFWFCFIKQRAIILFLLGIAGSVFFGEVVVMNLLGEGLYRLQFGAEHVYFTVGLFILLHWFGGLLQTRSSNSNWLDYGLILRLWTIRFGILTMFILSFEDPWRELIRSSHKHTGFILGCTIVMILFIAALIFLPSRLSTRKLHQSLKETIINHISTISFGLFYGLCSVLIILSEGRHDTTTSVILQVITNLALLLTGIWLIIKAYRTSSSAAFYMGIGVLLITALLRYVDLIGDYIIGSLVFFIAGIIMYVAARLWKGHLSIQEKKS